MAYSDFTIDELKKKFGLSIGEDTSLFDAVAEIPLPATLAETLRRYLPIASLLSTEKARSEFVIAPVLMEFKLLYRERISLFTGLDFNVDEKDGLKGRCDYILSRSREQLTLNAPICVLVEAKNENIIGGIPQCLAEMIAAIRYNRANGEPTATMYGVVTSGILWRFLKLEGSNAAVDTIEYPIHAPNKIFGILKHIALGGAD